MQTLLGWEVGMGGRRGGIMCYCFGVFFLQMIFFLVVLSQKCYLKGYLGNRVSNGFP